MILSYYRRFRARIGARRNGFALVISLIAVVLVTVLVVAFFSRALLNRQVSFSSISQVRADLLAHSALDIVTGELRQEIVDHSNPPVNGAYTPVTPNYMLPYKDGVSGADANVGTYTICKVAASNTPIDHGSSNTFGSSVGIDQPSINGRSQSQQSWFTNGPGLGSTTTLPTWVYLARNQTIPTTLAAANYDPNSDTYVIGRFTYTVYNTSGLLDANVAGYPASSTDPALPTLDIATKASLAYADLTALGITQAQTTALAKWRNQATFSLASLATASKPLVFDEWASALPGIGSTVPGNGTTAIDKMALEAASTGHVVAAAGDNVFVSRRDLLKYVTTNGLDKDTSSNPTYIAGNLSHFSAASNAPSWGPSNLTDTSGGASVATTYGTNANSTTSVNRLVPAVLWKQAGNVQHYNDDGTYTKIAVTTSDPVVLRRFSLAKIAWLGHNGANATAFSSTVGTTQQAAAIQACFGLSWDQTNLRWTYNNGDPSNILTLEQVRGLATNASTGLQREPDFFELLKAGILSIEDPATGKSSGSLGEQPGTAANLTGTVPTTTGPMGSLFDTFSADEDFHVLQIGANIIDQADSDNYPTAIYMNLQQFPGQPGMAALYNTVFGVENLPMLDAMGLITVQMDCMADNGPEGAWMQPELWNPHESTTATNVSTTPTSLRLTTYGSVSFKNTTTGDSTINYSTPIDFGTTAGSPQSIGIVNFVNPAASSTSPQNFFDHPQCVVGEWTSSVGGQFQDSKFAPSSTQASVNAANQCPTACITVDPANTRHNTFLAVSIGQAYRQASLATAHSATVSPSPYLTFVLEYYDGSTWRPYSVMSRISTIATQGYSSHTSYGRVAWNVFGGRPDSRTDRLSVSGGATNSGSQPFQRDQNETMRTNQTIAGGSGKLGFVTAAPQTSAGFTNNNGSVPATLFYLDEWAQNLPSFSVAPSGTDFATYSFGSANFYYKDPDKIYRYGDGWQGNFGTTGDGMMQFHTSASDTSTSKTRRRPVILNRPFRSVAELGYTFRDEPFKTLDFWSSKSADAGLLDLFCTTDASLPAMTGRINPNLASPKAMQAVLHQTIKEINKASSISLTGTDSSMVVSSAEASLISRNIATRQQTTTNLLLNPGDLVTNLGDHTAANHDLSAWIRTSYSNSISDTQYANQGSKTYGEAPLRALANVTDTNSWNLLIDVVAQVGRLKPNATSLQNFVVEGEHRYWLHVSINRATGKIIRQQLEPVYDAN